jgi:hypothetical protein
VEGGNEAEEEADGQDEDAEGDGLVSPIDEKKGDGEKKTKEGLGLASVDRKAVVCGVEHLG